MKPERLILPVWVRLNQEAREEIHKQWLLAARDRTSAAYIDFASTVVDYREACRRSSYKQTWRTRLTRLLLWMVEKIAK